MYSILNSLFYIIGLFYVSYLVRRHLVRIGGRFIIMPGVVFHELSHLLACFITFAKVEDINLYSIDGGHIRHRSSPIPLGNAFIAIAPFITGLGSLILIPDLLNIQSSLQQVAVTNLLYSNPLTTLIYIILILEISSSLAPSYQDLKNAFLFLGIGSVIIFLLLNSPAMNKVFAQLKPILEFSFLQMIGVFLVLFLLDTLFSSKRV